MALLEHTHPENNSIHNMLELHLKRLNTKTAAHEHTAQLKPDLRSLDGALRPHDPDTVVLESLLGICSHARVLEERGWLNLCQGHSRL